MSKKRFIILLIVFVAIVSNYLIFTKIGPNTTIQPKLVMNVKCGVEQLYQIYYSNRDYKQNIWSEDASVTANYNKKNEINTMSFSFPQDTKYIRLDLGQVEAAHSISDVSISCLSESITLDLKEVSIGKYENMISSFEVRDGSYYIETEGTDSFLVLDVRQYDFHEFVMKAQEMSVKRNQIFLCFAVDILCLMIIFLLERFIEIPKEVYQNRKLVLNLAKNDFKTKYAGSYLGIIWAFVQPIVTIAVYTFVFQVGFRSGAVMECPFVLWLMAGMVPWFFFSDALNGGTSSMIEYSYLVKKVVFNISILPVVKIISALFVHVFFVFITVMLFTCFGYFPDLYVIQVIYYSLCLAFFVLGLTYATCSIVIFFRDFGQIISIFLQVGVWMTPIMWQETMISESYRWILKLNPLYYVVSGYRDALIDKVWFWENPNQFVYFWFVTVVVFVLGTTIFKRLKIHFADVL